MTVDQRKIKLGALLAALAAAFLFSLIVLSSSSLKNLLLAIILVAVGIWIVARRVTYAPIKRLFLPFIIGAMIFTVAFASAEFYLFRFTLYPPPQATSQQGELISNENVLNVALGQIVNDIENSAAFSLLRIEHPGKITLESIDLNNLANVQVQYTTEDGYSISFSSSYDRPYSIMVFHYSGQRFSEKSTQPTEEAIAQIDSLGLAWFYNRALDLARNRTATLPSIDQIIIEVAFREHGDYQGLTLLLIGSQKTNEIGQQHFGSTLIVSFQPNGTLLYMTQPPLPR